MHSGSCLTGLLRLAPKSKTAVALQPWYRQAVMVALVPTTACPVLWGRDGAVAGLGTFGRVRLVRHRASGKPLALKILKKSEVCATAPALPRALALATPAIAIVPCVVSQILRLKQVDHVKSELAILSAASHPFIVNLCVWFMSLPSGGHGADPVP